MGQAPPFARRVGNDGDAGLGAPRLNRQALGRENAAGFTHLISTPGAVGYS